MAKANQDGLATWIVDEDHTVVLAKSKGLAQGLFKQLLAKGKTFRVRPVDAGYCEFRIEETNEPKSGWWRE